MSDGWWNASHVGRGRRKGKRALPSQTIALLRSLISDDRFPRLGGRAQAALLLGVVELADLDGRFWPKRKTWAVRLGISERSLSRAVEELEKVGLLQRRPWLRPPGARGGAQGSNTYVVDQALVRKALTETPRLARLDDSDKAPRVDESDKATSLDDSDNPERFLNENLNGSKALPVAKELKAVELIEMARRDPGFDCETPNVVRSLAARLPEAGLAKVLESARTQSMRSPARYIVRALSREVEERS